MGNGKKGRRTDERTDEWKFLCPTSTAAQRERERGGGGKEKGGGKEEGWRERGRGEGKRKGQTWLPQHGSESLVGGDDWKEVHPKTHGGEFAATVELVEEHYERFPERGEDRNTVTSVPFVLKLNMLLLLLLLLLSRFSFFLRCCCYQA